MEDEVESSVISGGDSLMVFSHNNGGSVTAGMVILFGTILLITISMAAKTWLLGDYRAILVAVSMSQHQQHSSQKRLLYHLPTFTLVFTILYHLSLLGCILWMTYILEHYPPFPPLDIRSSSTQDQIFDADYCLSLIALAIAVSWMTSQGSHIGQTNKRDNDHDNNQQKQQFDDYENGTGTAAHHLSRRKSHRSIASSIASSRGAKSEVSNNSSIGSAEEIDWQSTTPSTGNSNGNNAGNGAATENEEDQQTTDQGTSAHSSLGQSTTNNSSAGALEDVTLGELSGGESLMGASSSAATSWASSVGRSSTSSSKQRKIKGSGSVYSKKNDGSLFNLYQTQELKGCLSILFLIYQLTHASHLSTTSTGSGEKGDNNPNGFLSSNASTTTTTTMYYFMNASRVGASTFVFLTAFGHYMYFYCRNLPPTKMTTRVFMILFRYNMVALFLSWSLNLAFLQYYVCPLHSLVFLSIFILMRFGGGGKLQGNNSMPNYSKWGMRWKMLLYTSLVFLMWDLSGFLGLFDLIFNPFFPRRWSVATTNNGGGGIWGNFMTQPFGATGRGGEVTKHAGPLYEWYYHTHLHHWVVIAGIIYAMNYPITNLLVEKTEMVLSMSPQQSSSYGYQVHQRHAMLLARGTICVSLMLAFYLWWTGPFTNPPQVFDSIHAYFAFFPILCFIYFRNLTLGMRQFHLSILKSIGTYSLEIFLFHHHIFLSNNGQSMLVLLPGYPKCNILVTGLLLLCVAKTVHNLTSVLGTLLLPSDSEGKCIRSLVVTSLCVLGCYGLAKGLQALEMTSAMGLAICIVLLGLVLYQIVMDMTWAEYRNADRQLESGTSSREESTWIARMSPPLIGILVVMMMGISWNIMAVAGAAGGSGPLPASCEALINEGIWAPVNACNEFQRGHDYRHFSVGSYYRTCQDAETMHWGWRISRPNAHCPFRSRTTNELQKRLKNRRVVFIGDLMVRNLFHAFCRVLGDFKGGKYDATVADHADITKGIGSVRVEYKWAPLAMDQVTKLRDVRSKNGPASQKQQVDLLIVGGGTLDRLHVWATDEDQESHKVSVQKLAKELDFASSPTVWCTPTTINTAALGNDEKRDQMNEMAISEIRTMYIDLDVESSANFVLDGPSYSRGRVAESYDGVLYPNSVYDAGIQIVANALDWIMPLPHNDETVDEEEFLEPPQSGNLSNPFLGLMMACFSMIGLFFFDGYLGFSFLASLWVRRGNNSKRKSGKQQPSSSNIMLSNFMPNDLYNEAFIPFHQRLKLPLSKSERSKSSRKQQNGHDLSLPHLENDADILSILESDSLFGGTTKTKRRG